MAKVRVGVIGVGMMGKQHMEALRRIRGVTLAAVAGRKEETPENPDEFGCGVIFYENYKEMIDQAEIDSVHICTPNDSHFEIAAYALINNKHVYCEKPFTLYLEQAEQLIKMAKEKRRAAGVNYNYRNNAMVQEMRQRILNGNAGNPYLIHGCYLQDWLMFDTDYSWRLETTSGSNTRAISDIGSHWFDTAQYASNSKIDSVYAKLITAIPVRKKPRHVMETFRDNNDAEYTSYEVNSDDIGVICVKFENGCIGSLLLSQVSGGHKNDLRLSIDCQNYSMNWKQEDADKLVIGTRNNGNMQLFASADALTGDAKRYAALPQGHAVAWHDALTNGIREFYESIFTDTYWQEKQTYATFEDGLYIMKIVEACVKSSCTDNWVKIDENKKEGEG